MENTEKKKGGTIDFEKAKRKLLNAPPEMIEFTMDEQIALRIDEIIEKYCIDDRNDLAIMMVLAMQFDPHIYDNL